MPKRREELGPRTLPDISTPDYRTRERGRGKTHRDAEVGRKEFEIARMKEIICQ